MGVASTPTHSEFEKGVEHFCTKQTVIWCSTHIRYECPICEAWYDDKEYDLLPKSVKDLPNKPNKPDPRGYPWLD